MLCLDFTLVLQKSILLKPTSIISHLLAKNPLFVPAKKNVSKLDIIHVSTGGVGPANIDAFPGYQTKPAETVKNLTGLPTITGGLLLNIEMLEDILGNNRSDFVFLGRLLLRDPYFPLRAAAGYGDDTAWPQQYLRAR